MFAADAKPIAQNHPQTARQTLPLVFEQNAGQFPKGTFFAGRTESYSVEVRAHALRFLLPGGSSTSVIEMQFVGAQPAHASGLSDAGFQTNYYVGNNPRDWKTGILNFNRIALRGLYPGIEAQLYSRGEKIEHDFILAPGADPSLLTMNITGAEKASLTAAGDVDLAGAKGYLQLHKPVAYQVLPDGTRQPVDARFDLAVRKGGAGLQFKLGAYDRSRELVIDPVITYATFAAGTLGSTAATVASDNSGNVYLSGITTSPKFGSASVTNNNCGSSSCASSIFIVKFASGSYGVTPAWLTYIGLPTGATVVTSSVANTANLFVGGYTSAASMPPAASNGTTGYVGFVSGLSASSGMLSGTNLIYADGQQPNNNSVEALALDGVGNLFVTGALGSTTTTPTGGTVSPTTVNAFSIAPAVTGYSSSSTTTPGNAYVAAYAAATPVSGSPAFFTYIQQNTLAAAIGIYGSGSALAGAASVYVAGETAGGFISPPALTAEMNSSGGYDAFELNMSLASAAAPTVTGFAWINGTGGTSNTKVVGLVECPIFCAVG